MKLTPRQYNSIMNMTTPRQRPLRVPLLTPIPTFAWLMLCAAVSLQSADRPNILYIMSDDHTSQAVGAYGKRLASLDPTPTIDRLAKEGMLFENVFCNNSICTPSRASIITGQYPQSNGVLDLDGSIPPDAPAPFEGYRGSRRKEEKSER